MAGSRQRDPVAGAVASSGRSPAGRLGEDPVGSQVRTSADVPGHRQHTAGSEQRPRVAVPVRGLAVRADNNPRTGSLAHGPHPNPDGATGPPARARTIKSASGLPAYWRVCAKIFPDPLSAAGRCAAPSDPTRPAVGRTQAGQTAGQRVGGQRVATRRPRRRRPGRGVSRTRHRHAGSAPRQHPGQLCSSGSGRCHHPCPRSPSSRKSRCLKTVWRRQGDRPAPAPAVIVYRQPSQRRPLTLLTTSQLWDRAARLAPRITTARGPPSPARSSTP